MSEKEAPLAGIKVIDFTGVQAGPACTQMLAWFGADVLKVERTSGGDVTRHQLRDIPDIDALYFTMLNSNKRSLAINTKTPEGKAVMEKLIAVQDRLARSRKLGPVARLGPTTTARTLRKDGGPFLVTDGPYAETKEQILGFYMVDLEQSYGATGPSRPPVANRRRR